MMDESDEMAEPSLEMLPKQKLAVDSPAGEQAKRELEDDQDSVKTKESMEAEVSSDEEESEDSEDEEEGDGDDNGEDVSGGESEEDGESEEGESEEGESEEGSENGGDDGGEDEEWETDADEEDEDPSALLDEDDESNDEDVETCPICLNKFRDQDVGSPEACDHTFCLECIQEWSKNVNTCPVDRQVFHLILAKHAWDDKVFKRIEVQDKNLQSEEDEEVTFCEVCGRSDREDRLLLCDQCDAGYHIECLTPPLDHVPIDEWFCPECTTANQENMAETVDDSEEMHDIIMENPSLPSLRPSHQTRRIARTRAFERVRTQLEELRTRRARRERRRIESSSEEEQFMVLESEEEISVPSGSNSAAAPKKKTPVKRKKTRRKTKRKSPKKRITRKKATPKKKRKRKGTKRKTPKRKGKRKTKKKVKRKTVTVKRLNRNVVPISTVKSRLAGRLGLTKPPTGQSIPLQKLPHEKAMDSQRAEIGITSLSILGSRDDLGPCLDESAQHRTSTHRSNITNLKVSKPNQKYSTSALLSHKPVGKPKPFRPFAPSVETTAPVAIATPSPLDLLGSIMADQKKLQLCSQDVTIKRDGSLIAKKPAASTSSSSVKLDKARTEGTTPVSNIHTADKVLVDYATAEDSTNDSDKDSKPSERILMDLSKVQKTVIGNVDKSVDASSQEDNEICEQDEDSACDKKKEMELYDPFDSEFQEDDEVLDKPNSDSDQDLSKERDEYIETSNISDSEENVSNSDNSGGDNELHICDKKDIEEKSDSEGVENKANVSSELSESCEENVEKINNSSFEAAETESVESDVKENDSVNSGNESEKSGGSDNEDNNSEGAGKLDNDSAQSENELTIDESICLNEVGNTSVKSHESGEINESGEIEDESVDANEPGEIIDESLNLSEPGEIIEEVSESNANSSKSRKLVSSEHHIKWKSNKLTSTTDDTRKKRKSSEKKSGFHSTKIEFDTSENENRPKKFKSFSLKKEPDILKRTKDRRTESAFDKPIEKDEGLYSCLLAEEKITTADIAGYQSPRHMKRNTNSSLKAKRESEDHVNNVQITVSNETRKIRNISSKEKKFVTEDSEEERNTPATKIHSVYSVYQRLEASDTQENPSGEKRDLREKLSEERNERKEKRASHKERRRSDRRERERSHSKDRSSHSVEIHGEAPKDVRVIVISDDERESDKSDRRSEHKHRSHRDRHRDSDRERDRNRDKERDRDKDRHYKNRERSRHSRSRSRSRERHRHRRRDHSRSRSREKSQERYHRKKKRDRDRSREKDRHEMIHERHVEKEHQLKWSRSPHRRKEREKDEFGRDKYRHDQSDDKSPHKYKRSNEEKSDYSDTKKTRIIESEVVVKKAVHKDNEPYNVIKAPVNENISDDRALQAHVGHRSLAESPPLPPADVHPPPRPPSGHSGMEEGKYDPAFPTDSFSPQPQHNPFRSQAHNHVERHAEYMNQGFQPDNPFQHPVVSLGNVEDQMSAGPPGLLGDGPILFPPPNVPPPNQPPSFQIPMSFGMLPPGFQPSMQPGIPPQRQILVNPVLLNRPPQIGHIPNMSNPVPQFRWEVPPQGMLPVHNRFSEPLPRGPMVMNGPFESMPPPTDNVPAFPPVIQRHGDPQAQTVHFQDTLLPPPISMHGTAVGPGTIPTSQQTSLPVTVVESMNHGEYSHSRPSLLGAGPNPMSFPPPELPMSNPMSHPPPALDSIGQIPSLLSAQPQLSMMSKKTTLNQSESKDGAKAEDNVFKVPLPPSLGNKIGNSKNRDVTDTSEIVDMDVDMDMSSPVEEDNGIELTSNYSERRGSHRSRDARGDSPNDIPGSAVELSRKEKGSRDPRNSSKSSKSSRRSSEHRSRRSSKSGKENSPDKRDSAKHSQQAETFKPPESKSAEPNNVQPAVKQLEEISKLLSQQFQLALIAKKQNAENPTSKQTPSTPPEIDEREKVSPHVKKSKHGHGRHPPVKMNDEELHAAIQDLTAQEEVPSSAVELTNNEKYIKKLHLQERVVEEVKLALKPFYSAKKVNKEQYKDILRRAVPKVCHCKSGDINPMKIRSLVDAYVDKYRHGKKHSKNLELEDSS